MAGIESEKHVCSTGLETDLPALIADILCILLSLVKLYQNVI